MSAVISGMAYGGVVSLTLSYIPLLLKTSNDISRRMRNFLLLYVTFMVTISTIYTITMIIALTNNLFLPYNWKKNSYVVQNGFLGGLCVVLASWGADGFMVCKIKGFLRKNSTFLRSVVSSGDVRYCTRGSLDLVG